MSLKNVLLITGTGMASVNNEAYKIQVAFHNKGIPLDICFFNIHQPSRTRVPKYNLAIWWTPLLPMFINRQKPWLNPQKENIALSYYVIEGVPLGIGGCKDWLKWQYIVTPSNFAKGCLEEMGIKVREVVPHSISPIMPIDHVYGRTWRDKFPRDKQILLYNGSQINRKALPKLRKAIDILSTKRSDFVMVFHTDNVKQDFHTKVQDLYGVNTVVECDFPHMSIDKAYAKMFYCDIGVHPAVVEGFGLPVLEFLNMGKTLVCVNAYGVNEIANPKNSFMVINTNPIILAWSSYIKFKAMDYSPQDLATQIGLALDASDNELFEKKANALETAKRFHTTYDRFTEFV